MKELTETGVKVRVLNMELDASTLIGRFAMRVLAAFGELERDMAVDRIRSGLARAKERGVVFGSVRRFTNETVEDAYKAAGTREKARLRLGCSRITVIRGLDRIKAARAAKETA